MRDNGGVMRLLGERTKTTLSPELLVGGLVPFQFAVFNVGVG